MKKPQIVHSNVEFRLDELARSLVGKRLDDLTVVEKNSFHLCRILGMVAASFGPEGMDPGVIIEL